MGCERIDMGKGNFAFVCSRGRKAKPKCKCGREARYQCDDETAPGQTCDAYICPTCATWARKKVDTHYCPEHKAAHEGE